MPTALATAAAFATSSGGGKFSTIFARIESALLDHICLAGDWNKNGKSRIFSSAISSAAALASSKLWFGLESKFSRSLVNSGPKSDIILSTAYNPSLEVDSRLASEGSTGIGLISSTSAKSTLNST